MSEAYFIQTQRRIGELQDENERLREALDKIDAEGMSHSIAIIRDASPQCPKCGAHLTQPGVTVTGVCGKHGIQHDVGFASRLWTARAVARERDELQRRVPEDYRRFRLAEDRAEAAEAAATRATDMERVLRELVDAVRILDVMLREPAAKGLMSAEDYRSYLSGAWLGVDEKTAAARAALSAREEAR